ncbi:MAG TPA: glycosyltransferase family 4 protein [Candidatus Acidoferrales bacterium]|nr:glycosyltransferase family 4 protein [Candidatus Acidoferrales bacterium]
MKIALVAGRGIVPSAGGQGSFCRYLAEGLTRLGHDVVIIGDPRWVGFCRSLGAGYSGRVSAEALRRADVVHVNGPGRTATAMALALRRPVVMTHQDASSLCPIGVAWTPEGCDATGGNPGPCRYCPRRGVRGLVLTRALRWLAARCTNVAVSQSLLERLRLSNGAAILSPVALQPAAGPGTDGLVAFAGRLSPEKGLGLLLRAMARVQAARLRVAGDGPLRRECEDLAHSLGIAGRVRFHGQFSQSQVGDLYAQAAVVCAPTLCSEGFGYAAAEAMAAGRAVLASDGGAFRELLADGRGWLCPPTVETWASALREALEDPVERQIRGKRARAFVRAQLDPGVVAKLYESAYTLCLPRA